MGKQKTDKSTDALSLPAKPKSTFDKDAWLALRKAEGKRIDPETAKVRWVYAQALDPYGIDPDLSDELQCIGRDYFARNPDSDIWVWSGDVPKDIWRKLEERPGGLLKETKE